MTAEPKIFVAGHLGMVGSAIVRQLRARGQERLVVRPRSALDLMDQRAVSEFFAQERPDHVYVAAAKVGGIHANNTYPAEFIYSNLMVQANVIHAAWVHGVKRLLFLGSSCIYPKHAEQPMKEEALLGGALEPTNEPYAVAKIAGIKLCESYKRQYGCDFRSVMPTNLYGPGDTYHPQDSHVVPAMIRRFHEARQQGARSVTVWGTGRARREFLFVEDMARACLKVMDIGQAEWEATTSPMQGFVNIGYGSDVAISELAEMVARVTGFGGSLHFDTSRPDGTPRKLLDSTRIRDLGWSPEVALEDGLARTYKDFQSRL